MKDAVVEFYRAGNYSELREKILTEKNVDSVYPLMDAMLADYAAASPLPAAKQLIKPEVKEAAPLPIVPDPGTPEKNPEEKK